MSERTEGRCRGRDFALASTGANHLHTVASSLGAADLDAGDTSYNGRSDLLMLSQLSIRDIVLIERLDLTFEAGLSVLTGETGAGKSILLDSLSLALGGRVTDRWCAMARTGAGDGRLRCAARSCRPPPAA